MGRQSCVHALLATLVLAATLQAQGLEEAIDPQEPLYSPLELENCSTDGEYLRSRVKFTLDAMYMSRAGAGGSDPLILDAPFPLGAPLLTADELDIDGLWGGRLELVVYDPTPNPTDLRISYLWTERGEGTESRSSSPADILFFNIVDAAPSNTYTARLQSRFALGDIGIRKEKRPGVGVFGGLALGELNESLDLLTGPTTGFFSQGENKLYGANFGVDAQLWSNGYCRLEGGLGWGLYYNDIEIRAQSQNWQRTWSDSSAAYMGQMHFAFVVPAYPFNFRLGYQVTHVGGLGLLADQSDGLRLFDGGGSVDTDSTAWHGLLLGIEYLR